MTDNYKTLPVAEIRKIAADKGIETPGAFKKAELIEKLRALDPDYQKESLPSDSVTPKVKPKRAYHRRNAETQNAAGEVSSEDTVKAAVPAEKDETASPAAENRDLSVSSLPSVKEATLSPVPEKKESSPSSSPDMRRKPRRNSSKDAGTGFRRSSEQKTVSSRNTERPRNHTENNTAPDAGGTRFSGRAPKGLLLSDTLHEKEASAHFSAQSSDSANIRESSAQERNASSGRSSGPAAHERQKNQDFRRNGIYPKPGENYRNSAHFDNTRRNSKAPGNRPQQNHAEPEKKSAVPEAAVLAAPAPVSAVPASVSSAPQFSALPVQASPAVPVSAVPSAAEVSKDLNLPAETVSGIPAAEENIPAAGALKESSDVRDTEVRPNAAKYPADIAADDKAEGVLEVMPDGFGFIRSNEYLPGDEDVYVAPSQIKKFNLKTGDRISGVKRIKAPAEKFSAILRIEKINGMPSEEHSRVTAFENLTPVFPHERLHLETADGSISMRITDLLSPIGKGQRGMIVAQPKVGKTTLLKQITRALQENHPKLHVIVLLIDERPEEVTDMKDTFPTGTVEIVYSTFDELPEHHKHVSEMVIERAKRLVELKQDVVILLDSITRLTRAYNITVVPSGRTLSGGLDPAALYMPKRFFGAARCMKEGGSLTILATALQDTGSRLDDVVYEEFKGTGNMELVLDRKLSERRIFPAIDILKSGTRRDDLLLTQDEQEAVSIVRRATNAARPEEAAERILELFSSTPSNEEFIRKVKMIKFL